MADGCDTSFSDGRSTSFSGVGCFPTGSGLAFPVDGSLEGGGEFLVLVEDQDAVEGDAVLEGDFFDFRLQLVTFFEGEEVRDGGFDAEGLSAVSVGCECKSTVGQSIGDGTVCDSETVEHFRADGHF